jgi:hypothetical protein
VTDLKRRLERRTPATRLTRGRPIVVILSPPAIIGFRLAKTRTIQWTTIEACYAMACRQAAAAKKAAKKAARKMRREGR